jgi:hypothetical protein
MRTPEQRQQRRLAGLCTRCNQSARPERALCVACATVCAATGRSPGHRAYRNAWAVRRRIARRRAGKCIKCAQPARSGRGLCVTCGKESSLRLRAWRLARLPATCKCGAPRATVLGLLCRRCLTIAERRRLAKVLASQCSHKDGFVIFVPRFQRGLTAASQSTYRLIDLADEDDSINFDSFDLQHLRAQTEDLAVLTFDEGGDWRSDEVRLGASVQHWIEPQDHLPPSWNR